MQKENAIELVKRNPEVLKDLEYELKNDAEVVMTAIRTASEKIAEAEQLSYEGNEPERNFLFILKSRYSGLFQYASEELKDNKEFALEAISYLPYSYNHVSENLRRDKNFLTRASEVVQTSISLKARKQR